MHVAHVRKVLHSCSDASQHANKLNHSELAIVFLQRQCNVKKGVRLTGVKFGKKPSFIFQITVSTFQNKNAISTQGGGKAFETTNLTDCVDQVKPGKDFESPSKISCSTHTHAQTCTHAKRGTLKREFQWMDKDVERIVIGCIKY